MATVRVEIEDYDDDSESVSEKKEIINVAHFVPDTKKKPEQIRATCGPHVGQRIRLKLAPFDDDNYDESGLVMGEKKKERRDAEDRQIARSVEFYEKKQGRFGLRS